MAFNGDLAGDARRLALEANRYVWHHAYQPAEHADTGPLLLVEGSGAMVRDLQGREYIDGTAILGVTQIGHGRKEMADAIAAQVQKLEYGSCAGGFSNVPAALLAKKLAELTPGDLEVSYFASTGAEAIEAALKIARQYHLLVGAPRRTKIIARQGGYHGTTLGALSATGIASLRAPFEPLLPGFFHVGQPYAYRAESELGCKPEEAGARAAEALEREILAQGPGTVAAFIAEPVAVPQAIKVPPPDYWPRVRDICRRHGVLLILDEVFNGFGRTGRLFAAEHWSLEPDILVVSKGLTSGYFPLSAAIAGRHVAEAFWGASEKQFAHGSTYSGHPVGCAAALANLAIFERERLVDRAAERGAQLLAGLEALSDRPFVGNVSGIGLLQSIELVIDRKTRQSAPPEVARSVRDRAAELGLIVRAAYNSVYLHPPLVIDGEQVERMLTILRDALDEAAARHRDLWRG
jgi:adenosylmethionine-8-amino-7-oxononanoate aminotransferase